MTLENFFEPTKCLGVRWAKKNERKRRGKKEEESRLKLSTRGGFKSGESRGRGRPTWRGQGKGLKNNAEGNWRRRDTSSERGKGKKEKDERESHRRTKVGKDSVTTGRRSKLFPPLVYFVRNFTFFTHSLVIFCLEKNQK